MVKDCGGPNEGEFLIYLGDSDGHVSKQIDGFDGVHGDLALVRKMWKEDCF